MELDSLLETNTWSKSEFYHRNRHRYRNKYLIGYRITFSEVFDAKLRLSYLGIFLKHFNARQPQSSEKFQHKLALLKWDIAHQHDWMKEPAPTVVLDEHGVPVAPVEEEPVQFDEHGMPVPKPPPPPFEDLTRRDNDFIENVLSVLERWAVEKEVIDMQLLYDSFRVLTVRDSDINELDKGLRKFHKLEILNLSANWLKEVTGKYLPRKLRYLELYGNIIESIETLLEGLPAGLIYLGLGHNRLITESRWHLLAQPGINDHLRVLDLSDNNLMSLRDVLTVLSPLPHLINLKLDGNPCSMTQGYKDCVVSYFPQIRCLDDTNLLDEDYEIHDDYKPELHDFSGSLTFTVFRIFHLPPPPVETFNKKPVLTSFHFEVELPLLDQILRNVPQPPVDENAEPPPPIKPPPPPKKGKVLTVYDKPDEHQAELFDKRIRSCFRSERIAWNKTMVFPMPTIIVPTPDDDLVALRDTFWSEVMVKFVYLGYQPPEPVPPKSVAAGLEEVEEEKPQETIVKKITLAKFPCQLRNMNWSDRTIDFYWADNMPNIHPAIPVEGSLLAIEYVEKAKPVKAKPGEIVIPPVLFPELFTIQVGFGLERLSQDPPFVPVPIK